MSTDDQERERTRGVNDLRSEIGELRIRLDFTEKSKDKIEAKLHKIENEVISYMMRFSIGTIVVLVSTIGFLVKQFMLK
jgi:hypothetical protein